MINVPDHVRRVLLPWGALALILLMTVAAYRGVIHNGFVLDDFHTVVNNRSLDSFGGASQWIRFRPVTMTSYALERILWGDSAAGHHVGNLLVHAAVVVLTGVLARRLWRNHVSAVVAAGIVALHPLNSEAVNYIAARSSTLMTLLVLVAVGCYDRALRGLNRRSRAGWLAGATAAGLAAVGAKEAGVVLPLLIICWDRAADPSRPWTTTLVRSTPFWAVIVVLLALRAWMLGSAVGITPVGSAFQSIAFDAKLMLVSFGHWWWPMNLAIDYAWPTVIPRGEAIMWMGGAVATGIGTWALVRRGFQAGWCLVWFWASLLPIAVLPFITRLALYQEHRSYLGGIALAWAAGGVLSAAYLKISAYRVLRFAAVTAAVGLAASAAWADMRRTSVWVDPEHVWEDTIAQYPDSAVGHSARGLRLFHAGDLKGAQAAFEHALTLDGSLAATHGYLGVVYAEMGIAGRSIAELALAQAMAPSNTKIRMNLGKAYEAMGRTDQALEVYEQLLRQYPTHAPALGRSGVILERAGRLAEAAERYRSVVTLDPTDDTAREALGAVFLRLERWGEAEDVFTTLVARSPESGASWFNLGVARERLGRDGEALEAYARAAERSAQDPDPHFRMGMIQTRNGNWDAAAASYEEALAQNPGHFFSHMNLALVAERLGDVPRAREHYQALLAMALPDAEYGEFVGQARAALTRLGGSSRSFPPRVKQ